MPTHTIGAGETLWSVSQKYGCSLEAILAANPGIIPEQLQVGQTVNIPGEGGGNPLPGPTGGGGGGETFYGEATFYNLSGITACGTQHNDSELVCALNYQQFDPQTPGGNPNNNPLCGRQIKVKGPKGEAIVKIVDKLPSRGHGGLDLSPAAFQLVAGDLGLGHVPIEWQFL